jgi:hypothetical protein
MQKLTKKLLNDTRSATYRFKAPGDLGPLYFMFTAGLADCRSWSDGANGRREILRKHAGQNDRTKAWSFFEKLVTDEAEEIAKDGSHTADTSES